MLVKCQIESEKTLFNDLHGSNQQRFADYQCFAESSAKTSSQSNQTPNENRQKAAQARRNPVKICVTLPFYNKTMASFGLNNVDEKNVELDIEFIEDMREYL